MPINPVIVHNQGPLDPNCRAISQHNYPGSVDFFYWNGSVPVSVLNVSTSIVAIFHIKPKKQN